MKKKLCIIALSLLVICYLFTISASANESWTMSIIGTGQGGDVSIAKIGIDPNGKAYPYPPNPPPGFTVVVKIKGGTNGLSEEIRVPGSEQEVWGLSVMVGGANFGGSADPNQPNFFPVLTWDPNQRGPSDVLELRLGDANGPVIADMKTDNTYQTLQSDAKPGDYIPSLAYAIFSYAVVFDPSPVYYRDSDGDGYGDPNDAIQTETPDPNYILGTGDCDEADTNTYPGATELCDGKDNDCDGIIPTNETTDADGDGFVACNDCDDADPNTKPGGTERCDGKDNDCDGQVPVTELDDDGDGMSECEGDCDDTDNTIYLGAPELCDNKDNDCNLIVDDPNALIYSDYYRDADDDGYGDPNDKLNDCTQPDGYVLDPNDCDDTDAAINPGATEVCDDIDNDCDGIVDDPNVLTYLDYYRDADGDGYGDPNDKLNDCTQPDGYVLDPNDCDDTDAAINPGATEVYDGIDNDCKDGPDDHCYFTVDLYATGQDVVGQPLQQKSVRFGLDWELAGTEVDPNNWADDIVRIQLIDTNADITDPNTFVDTDYLVEDIRKATGQTEILWYVLVEIGDMADPNLPGYYPVLSWDPTLFGCTEVNGKEYLYELRRGLGASGTVLVDDMADANSYQTVSQDGDPTQYLTILWREKPAPPPPVKRQILPWPGVSNALGWVGFPYFPGGLPVSPLRSGYPPGLSIPSFPGTYPGFSYPGGMYPAWTSFVPRFPVTFPTLGIFSPIGTGWPVNYWTGFPRGFPYQTGWFYRNY